MHKLAASVIVLLGLIGIMVPSMAQAATREPLTGQYKICLVSDSTECYQSEGTTGNPVLTYHTGYSTWNLAGSNGELLENQSGNCLHGTDAGLVTVVSSCTTSNTASEWTPATWNGHTGLKNVAYGCFAEANGDANGSTGVCVPGGTSGDWLATTYTS
jgi:hypothetical protein